MSDAARGERGRAEAAAAYALGALDGGEREAFEARLAGDAELRATVEAYRASLELVADGVPGREPPAGLRERMLARARAERVPAAASGPAQSPASARASAGPTGATASTPEVRGRPESAAPSRPGRVPPAVAWGLLAASVAGLVLVGLQNRSLRQDARRLSDELAQVRSVLAAAEVELARVDSLAAILAGPDVRLATLTGDAAPTVRLVWSPGRDALLVAAAGLPQPPPGRTFQLWGIRGAEAPVSLGTFASGPGGTALVTLSPGVPPDFEVGAVTEEPAGGSPQPTSQPFLVGSWRAALE